MVSAVCKNGHFKKIIPQKSKHFLARYLPKWKIYDINFKKRVKICYTNHNIFFWACWFYFQWETRLSLALPLKKITLKCVPVCPQFFLFFFVLKKLFWFFLNTQKWKLFWDKFFSFSFLFTVSMCVLTKSQRKQRKKYRIPPFQSYFRLVLWFTKLSWNSKTNPWALNSFLKENAPYFGEIEVWGYIWICMCRIF